MGLRLEKHLDKVREQYKAQKEEEETKKKFYHSPDTMRRDDIDGEEESSEGGTESLDHSSEFTPEQSPAPQVRSMSPQAPSPQPSPLATHRIMHNPQANGPTSPHEVKGVPDLALQHQVPGESQGGQAGGYNPYPPPTTAAPPSPPSQERTPVTTPTSLASATAIPVPSVPRGNVQDKEALFAYAWYHGSIPRDEALRRLESVGGFDG